MDKDVFIQYILYIEVFFDTALFDHLLSLGWKHSGAKFYQSVVMLGVV